jgi:transposase-like protein
MDSTLYTEKPLFSKFEGVALFRFMEAFPDEASCKQYLYNLKFSNGFLCPRCGHTKGYSNIRPYAIRCKKCRHIESCSANTLFHKLKFPLRKAFAIIFEMTTTANGMSAMQASRKYEINGNTAWLFMKKVRLSMESSNQYPMTANVFVDEYVMGGHEKGAVGRKNKSSKVKAIIAVETTKTFGIKRCYSMKIKDYSTQELKKIFVRHISRDAKVMTDKWRSYNPLKTEWKIKQHTKYKNNSPANRMIQQLKSWLRGTHHWVSDYHTETYLNEFSYRINRSQSKASIFHKCVERMVSKEKKCRLQLSQVKVMSRKEYLERVKIYRSIGANYKVLNGKVKLVA